MDYQVLVTGANGFLGRSLSEYLNLSGKTIIGISRVKFNAGYPLQIVGSLANSDDLKRCLHGVGVVIHTAARVHVMQEKHIDPLRGYREVNVGITLNLANEAVAAGVKRFIYLSSIKVNGENTLNEPFTPEDYFVPDDAYALSKYEAEQGLLAIARQTGMEVVIIRPPLVYGPNVKGNFLHLMRWVNKGVPLPLGAIHNQRSLVALDNLVDLIAICIDHPAAANQIFLVSDDEDLSTTGLLQRLGNALDKPARLLPVPQGLLEGSLKLIGKGRIAQRLCGNLQVDISKTKRLLNWQPPVAVDDALKKTADVGC